MDDSNSDVAFGPYRLSLRERLLFGPQGHIPLGSRAFDTLVVLLNGRGGIVSKDLLMSSVWPGVFVDENNLQVQISTLRRLLTGEAGQQFIQTVPGRGYRFTGAITKAAPLLPSNSLMQGGAEAAVQKTDEPLHNLPTQLTAMIGRLSELDAGLSLLQQSRLISLTGPGGIGKTKLALNTAWKALPRFPQGCWWIELGTVRDPALILDTIAAALKVPELPGRALGESIASWLRGRAMLLVFDNCEHLVVSVAEVAQNLLQNCPDVRLLVTSQEPLGIEGERVCRIAPFEVPELSEAVDVENALSRDAVRLFVERANAGDQRFELTGAMIPAILEICRHLDGIPLALELAAAHLPLLGLEPLRRRIVGGLGMRDDGHRRGTVRHRTLRAAIEWSYGLCSPQDRQMLRRLSIFAGGFTLEAAQAVVSDAGLADDDIVLEVSKLAHRSLLVIGSDLFQPRYRMLQPTQSFAAEKLDEADERPGIAQRHAAYVYAHFDAADAAWEKTPSRLWMPPLMAEMQNLRAALHWSLIDQNDVELGAQLAGSTTRFWFESFKFGEGRQWIDHALEACRDKDHPARLCLFRGKAMLSQDAQSAVATALQSVEIARRGDDRGQLGVCLRTHAAALYRQGRYAEAETAALEALDLLDRKARPKTYAKCVSDLCILRGLAGDLPAARDLNAQAQTLLKEVGDDRGAAICLQYAAELEFAAGNPAAAVALGEESAALFRSLNDNFQLCVGLGNIAAYALALDNVLHARFSAREALRLAQEIEDLIGITIAVEHLALAAALSGDFETAARLYGYCDHVFRSQGIERHTTERLGQERLAAMLVEKLGDDDHRRLTTEGALLTAHAVIDKALMA